MKMLLPSVADRREIDRRLAEFFHSNREASFNRAISAMCRFYGVRRPRIEWYEYLDWGKTAGRTFEDGRIHLVHPSNWKRGRVYYSERLWVQMIYHEMGHYVFWTDAERKADLFMRRMVSGIRAPLRRARRRRASGILSARAAASRRAKPRSRVAASPQRRRARNSRIRSKKGRAAS